jgi:hypothetical protein
MRFGLNCENRFTLAFLFVCVHHTTVAIMYAEPGDLVDCGKCGRRFNPDRIDKHENACLGTDQ